MKWFTIGILLNFLLAAPVLLEFYLTSYLLRPFSVN